MAHSENLKYSLFGSDSSSDESVISEQLPKMTNKKQSNLNLKNTQPQPCVKWTKTRNLLYSLFGSDSSSDEDSTQASLPAPKAKNIRKKLNLKKNTQPQPCAKVTKPGNLLFGSESSSDEDSTPKALPTQQAKMIPLKSQNITQKSNLMEDSRTQPCRNLANWKRNLVREKYPAVARGDWKRIEARNREIEDIHSRPNAKRTAKQANMDRYDEHDDGPFIRKPTRPRRL